MDARMSYHYGPIRYSHRTLQVRDSEQPFVSFAIAQDCGEFIMHADDPQTMFDLADAAYEAGEKLMAAQEAHKASEWQKKMDTLEPIHAPPDCEPINSHPPDCEHPRCEVPF